MIVGNVEMRELVKDRVTEIVKLRTFFPRRSYHLQFEGIWVFNYVFVVQNMLYFYCTMHYTALFQLPSLTYFFHIFVGNDLV